jgi:hypothetical protein
MKRRVRRCCANGTTVAFGELEQIFGQPLNDFIAFAALFKTVACVFLDRLQHPVPVIAVAKQVLVDERGERLEPGLADRFRGIERAAAGEDR